MITLSAILASLQASAVSILTADGFFNGSASINGKAIPIVTETKGDILQQIDLCLGQVGICALIMVPTFEFHVPEAQDLSGWAYLTIGIYENATLNINSNTQGTGIPSKMLAERIVCIMHWAPHNVPTAGVASELTAATRFLGAPRPIEFVSNGPPLQYNVSFKAHVTLNATYG